MNTDRSRRHAPLRAALESLVVLALLGGTASAVPTQDGRAAAEVWRTTRASRLDGPLVRVDGWVFARGTARDGGAEGGLGADAARLAAGLDAVGHLASALLPAEDVGRRVDPALAPLVLDELRRVGPDAVLRGLQEIAVDERDGVWTVVVALEATRFDAGRQGLEELTPVLERALLAEDPPVDPALVLELGLPALEQAAWSALRREIARRHGHALLEGLDDRRAPARGAGWDLLPSTLDRDELRAVDLEGLWRLLAVRPQDPQVLDELARRLTDLGFVRTASRLREVPRPRFDLGLPAPLQGRWLAAERGLPAARRVARRPALQAVLEARGEGPLELLPAEVPVADPLLERAARAGFCASPPEPQRALDLLLDDPSGVDSPRRRLALAELLLDLGAPAHAHALALHVLRRAPSEASLSTVLRALGALDRTELARRTAAEWPGLADALRADDLRAPSLSWILGAPR